MRLATRLILYIALSSVIPLAVLGGGASTVAVNRILEKTADLQGRTAEAIAVHVDTWVRLQLELVHLQTRALAIDRLSDAAKAAVPRLVLEQTPAARMVCLLDSDGTLTGPPVTSPTRADPAAAARALSRALEAAPVTRGPLVVSEPYRVPPTDTPSLGLATRSEGTTRIALELSLAPIAERVRVDRDEGVQVAILAANGDIVLGGGDLIEPSSVAELLGGTAVDVRYETSGGVAVVAATAPVLPVGWTVVVAEPVERSARALHEIRMRTAYIAGVALVFSLVVGVLFSRQLAQRVEGLTEAALKVADGDYGRTVPALSHTDEIADLTRAFNHMSGRLEADSARIARQRSEIAAFNEELQARVEARTQELRDAQGQLVQSARLAAVGEMGAGLAHELNNPIAGILGLAQVLLARVKGSKQAVLVENIEQQARRCRDILNHLLGLSHDTTAHAGRDEDLDLATLFRDTLPLLRGPLRLGGVEVKLDAMPVIWVRGQRAELGRALAQVVSSIRAAATSGGRLHVRTIDEDPVALVLTLEAERVAIGSDDWNAAGMGLWGAHRVLDSHGGRLIGPVPGREGGAEWRIELPRAKRQA